MSGRYIFDIETDGLEPNLIHCLYYHDLDNNVNNSLVGKNNIKYFIESADVLIGHNIIMYDLPALKKIYNVEPKKDCKVIDTLGISWYPHDEKNIHSLESYGEKYGIPKVEIEDWKTLKIGDYVQRAKRDVEINKALWEDQWSYLTELYGDHEKAMSVINYLTHKMRMLELAERNRWKLDISTTQMNLSSLMSILTHSTMDLEKVMPTVSHPIIMKRPAKLVKKDGGYTVRGKKWAEKCEKRGLNSLTETEIVIGYKSEPPNANSDDQIKDWLKALGWEPCTFKQGKNGKVPQIKYNKELAPSVKVLLKDHPELKHLEKVSVLSHRIGLLKGFLKNQKGGYLIAKCSGFTNTLRLKHTELVSLVGVDKPYGNYIRPCLVARDPSMCLMGFDMASLEDRTKQHFIYYYDEDYVKEMMTDDFDPHLDIAKYSKLLSAEQIQEYKSGVVVKATKVIRDACKTANYACTYNAGAKAIAVNAGVDMDTAKLIHSTYWSRNSAVKEVAKNCQTKTVRGKKWLYNPVSKYWYSLRYDKDRFSTLNQSTGAFAFDTLLYFLWEGNNRTLPLLGQFHDEGILEIRSFESSKDTWENNLKEAIEKTNQVLKLNRELDVNVQFGKHYGEIH